MSIPPNQLNYFAYIQLPINGGLTPGSPVNGNPYTPLPQFEFGIAGRSMYDYYWIYILGCMTAFGLAMANGANDVANSFATSVGSKALKMWQAIVIASFCEFGGAYLLGGRVTNTIRSNVAKPSAFVGHDDILMFAMLIALIVGMIWVFLATFLELPVSITHSTVGAILGAAMCSSAGAESIDWNTIGLIVASWFVSPGVSALIAFCLFTSIRAIILRHENSYKRTLVMFPFIVGLTFWVNAFFIIFKGGIATGGGFATGVSVSTGVGIGIAFGCMGGGIILTYLIFNRLIDRRLGALTEDQLKDIAMERGNIIMQVMDESSARIEDAKAEDKAKEEEEAMARALEIFKQKQYSLVDRVFHQPYIDAAVFASSKVIAIHRDAEVFDLRTELCFAYLQIFTACFASFAHGSNDVANSAGPLSAIVAIWLGGANTVQSKNPVPDWVLLECCAGIVVGLILFGHYIIAAMGVKYTKITPSRGFSAELSFSFVVVVGSFLGIPLSTTQCIVGALLGIGLAEMRVGAVNWWIFGKTVTAWIATLFVTALSSAILFSFSAYAPSMIYPLSKVNCMKFYGKVLNESNADPATYTLNTQFGTLSAVYGYPSTGSVYAVQGAR